MRVSDKFALKNCKRKGNAAWMTGMTDKAQNMLSGTIDKKVGDSSTDIWTKTDSGKVDKKV